jgi:AraC-like DNA-binding protein
MDDSWPPADPLGEALHVVRMDRSFTSSCEFGAPWGLELPAFPDTVMFHVVTAGRCWVEVPGEAPRFLQPGDLALVPHGQGHRLASAPGLPGPRLFDLPRVVAGERYEVLRQGMDGGGEVAHLVCGTVRFDHPAARQLVALLPRLLVVDGAASPEGDWIRTTVRFLAAEAAALRPGGDAVITRLADVLVIQAIRDWIDRDPAARVGWLGALRDPQLGRAIALIHRDPARPWSVADLAHEVAMSRSAFAARFAELVGEPPMRYLARWRMQVAATCLRERGAAVAEVALGLGYGSEAAFSRAFKRTVGVPPGAVRREAAGSIRG